MASIQLERVSKVFHMPGGRCVEAVRDMTFEVGEGELLVLLGPSGSGKTTTLRLIAGLEQPTNGSISINGKIVNEIPPKDRDIAMVFQNHALYPHLTVWQNIAFGLKLRRLPKSEIEQRVRDVSEILNITKLLTRLPETLSGGEQQRVALARAIARRPKALLLDEPFSDLDTPMRTQMRVELKKLHRRLRTTIVHVTHDQTEALVLGDRVAVMDSGQVQQIGVPLELYENPANIFVAGFLGWPPMNFALGMVEPEQDGCIFRFVGPADTARTQCLRFQIPNSIATAMAKHAGHTVVMGLRPEDIVHVQGNIALPTGTTVEAIVELIEPTGPQVHVYLRLGGWRCVAAWPRECAPAVEEKILLRFEMQRAKFFDAQTGKAIALAPRSRT
jgi:multiple sugar transport system ATP-binding protein